ncbi:MAG: S41 family peptidase [Gemmatimonadota bacterium]|nr:S41 family peptidase [Gemmatimonadota bacterium]
MGSARRWVAAFLIFGPPVAAQQVTRLERGRGFIMLDLVRADIAENYFDSAFGGVDLKAVFDSARAHIERAERVEQVLGAIAQATLELNDSHTAFIPPSLVYRAEYGWDMRFVGDTCRILSVRPGSDAEAKGMHAGDALLAVGGIPLTRRNLWQLRYAINGIQPRAGLRVSLQSPKGTPRDLDIAAKVKERRRIVDLGNSFDLFELIREGENAWEKEAPRFTEVADRVVVSRVHSFYGYTSWIDDLMDAARKRGALILDLRGNLGGSVNTLLRLTGQFYEKDFVVVTELGRGKRKEVIAKGAGKDRYQGAVVVLVDAESASASEVFARTLQLTGRGKVIGDRTAGAVRESAGFSHAIGTQTVIVYGTSVTIADLVMPDGGKLENAGVIPDEVVLPTGEDIAARNDPALARALNLLGVPFTPQKAGALPDR